MSIISHTTKNLNLYVFREHHNAKFIKNNKSYSYQNQTTYVIK